MLQAFRSFLGENDMMAYLTMMTNRLLQLHRGVIFFQDEKHTAKKIIVSVKGGETVTLAMLKDLIATVAGEKAQIGLFITLAVPTKSMIAEAARTGYYSLLGGQSFPKIQILTIESLLDGSQRPRYPDLAQGGLTFKQTKREKTKQEQLELLRA